MTDIKLEDIKPFLGIPITAVGTWLLTVWQQGRKSGAREQQISDQISSMANGQQEIRGLIAEQAKQNRESIQRVHEKIENGYDKLNERIDRIISK